MLLNEPDNPQKLPIFMQGSRAHLTMVPWTHTSQPPKRHLDWFSNFCKAHGRDQHEQTGHAARSEATAHILCNTV